MHLSHQQGLAARILQLVDNEVAFCLALTIHPLLDADGTHVDKFQDAGREQVVIVVADIAIGVEHIVGLLQITLQRYIAIPEQVFVDFSASIPYIYKVRYKTDCWHENSEE